MSTFLAPEPVCDYDTMFKILESDFRTEEFINEFGVQYRTTEQRTFDTWEAISRKTNLLAAVKNGHSIELSSFRLAYLRKPEAAKKIRCLEFAKCVGEFESFIAKRLFPNDHSAWDTFIKREITTVNNYRKALIYVCRDEVQAKDKDIDEVSEFQPFFGVYIRQLIARMSLTPGGSVLSNRTVDAANNVVFSTLIDVKIAKKVKEDYQLNQLENNTGNSPVVGSNGVTEPLTAELTSELVTVTVPAPATKTGCIETLVDVKLSGHTDLIVLDLSSETSFENFIQSKLKSPPITSTTEETADMDGSEVN
jgi:hypothetical protein